MSILLQVITVENMLAFNVTSFTTRKLHRADYGLSWRSTQEIHESELSVSPNHLAKIQYSLNFQVMG